MHTIILEKKCHFKLFHFIMQMTYECIQDIKRQQKTLCLSMNIIKTYSNIHSKLTFLLKSFL